MATDNNHGRISSIPSQPIREEVDTIVAGKTFYRSERLRSFLKFVVQQAIDKPDIPVKEYHIGTEVYGRPPSFDPRADPIVRVEARRLRAKLAEYYRGEGRNDALEIRIPSGTYVPIIRSRTSGGQAPGVSSEAIKWIAMEPFSIRAPAGETDAFSHGLAEELMHALTVAGAHVRDWRRAPAHKPASDDPANHSAVYAVIQVGGRKRGGEVRVFAGLIRTADRSVLWSHIYSRTMTDEFATQQELAEAIASAVLDAISHRHVRAAPRHSKPDPEPLRAYMKGRIHLGGQTCDELRKALEFLKESAILDPESTSLQIAIAEASLLLAIFGERPGTAALPEMRRAGLAALEIDPLLAEGHAVLGALAAVGNHDFAEAERRFLHALECNPISHKTRSWYGLFCLVPQGRFREGLLDMRLSKDSHPEDLVLRRWLVLRSSGHFGEAVSYLREVLDRRPGFFLAHWLLGMTYVELNDLDAGITTLEKAREFSRDMPPVIASLGHAYGLRGDTTKALRILAELEALSATRYVSPFDTACVHTGLDDAEKAMTCLENAFADQCPMLLWLAIDSRFPRLRRNSRFTGLLRRLGLESSSSSAAAAS